MLTTLHRWSLSWASWIKSAQQHTFKIYFNIILSSIPVSLKWFPL